MTILRNSKRGSLAAFTDFERGRWYEWQEQEERLRHITKFDFLFWCWRIRLLVNEAPEKEGEDG